MNGDLNDSNILKTGSISKKSKPKYELPVPENNDTEEYIEILKNFEISCQGSGRYIEAEMAKNRIKELKKEVDKKKKEDLKGQQEEEKVRLESAHTEEFTNFNLFWDKKLEEYINEAKKIEESLLIKQNEFFKTFEQEIEKSIPLKPKESAEFLNLKKVEEQLAQQKEYIEAHKVQQKRIQLEKTDTEKWLLERKIKIQKQLDQMKIKQKQEHQALLQKIESGQEEQKKTRAMELEKLLQKYQNLKKEMSNSHQTDLTRLEKTLKNPSTLSVSKFYGSRYMPNNSRFSVARDNAPNKEQQESP